MWMDARGLHYELLGPWRLGLAAGKSHIQTSSFSLYTGERYTCQFKLNKVMLCLANIDLPVSFVGVWSHQHELRHNLQKRVQVCLAGTEEERKSIPEMCTVWQMAEQQMDKSSWYLQRAVLEGAERRKRCCQHKHKWMRWESQEEKEWMTGEWWVMSDGVTKTDHGFQESCKNTTGPQQQSMKSLSSISPNNVSLPAFPVITTPSPLLCTHLGPLSLAFPPSVPVMKCSYISFFLLNMPDNVNSTKGFLF